MGTLKAVFILSIPLGFLSAGASIFSKVHCRQKFWDQGFKSITSKLINKDLRIYQSCNGFLVSSRKKAYSLPFSLSIELGEGL